MATIRFDNGVTGATLTAIGDDTFYSIKDEVIAGPPTVTSLTNLFAIGVSIKVIGGGVWKGQDVVVVANNTETDVHVFFGNPAAGATEVVGDYTSSARYDLMLDNPVIVSTVTYKFKPERVFIVGDRMIAYCSVYNNTTGVQDRVGFASCPMADIAAGSTDGWVAHTVSPVVTGAASAGAVWSCQNEHAADGMVFFAWSDYLSTGGKVGGQCGLAGFTAEGVYDDCIQMHTWTYADTHAHQPCLRANESGGWDFISSRNDAARYLETRTIADLADYTIATAGAVGLAGYTMASVATDAGGWSAATNTAGVPEPTAPTYDKSRWPNMFMLGAMPADTTQVMMGSDLGDGLINSMTINQTHDKAVLTNLFSPKARHISSDANESAGMFDLFTVARNGDHLAGIFFNELGVSSANIPEFSGIVVSSDGGLTWRQILFGTTSSGFTAHAGIAVLQDGTVVVGSVDGNSTLRVITPGSSETSKHLRVGSRAANLVGSAAEQGEFATWMTSLGTTITAPGEALPAHLHNTESFRIIADESSGFGEVRPTTTIVDETTMRANGMEMTYYTRRHDPISTAITQGMGIQLLTKLNLTGATFNATAQENTPFLGNSATNEWVAHTVTFKGDSVAGVDPTFTTDPSLAKIFVYGEGQAHSISNCDLYYERISTDGRCRPNFPGGGRTDAGLATARFNGLGAGVVGNDWTVLVKMKVPSDCWDMWSGGTADGWAAGVPVFSITDGEPSSTKGVTFDAHLTTAATASGASYGVGTLSLGFFDSDSGTRTEYTAFHAMRESSLIVAFSSNGNYAIGTPSGVVSGNRSGVPAFKMDTVTFSNIAGTDGSGDVLEMNHSGFETDGVARTTTELEAAVSKLTLPHRARSRDRSRTR